MRNFNQLYFMLVFGVKFRLGLIDPKWADDLYAIMGNKLKEYGCMPIKIGGVNDHVHILMSSDGVYSLSEIVKEVKTDSTRWINARRLTVGSFAWQEGSGRFSYSAGQIDDVKRYIINQPEHHKQISFRKEIENMIVKAGLNPSTFDLPAPLA